MATVKASDISTILKQREEMPVNAFGQRSRLGAIMVGMEKDKKGSKFNSKGISKGLLTNYEYIWAYMNKMPANAYYLETESSTIGAQGTMNGVECKLGLFPLVVPTEISTLARTVGDIIGPSDFTQLSYVLQAEERNFLYYLLLGIWRNTNGVIGRVREAATISATTVTIKVLDLAWLKGREGMYVDVFDTLGGSAVVDSWYIQSVDVEDESVTLVGTGGSGTAAQYGYIIPQDQYSYLPAGMAAAVSDGSEVADNSSPEFYWFADGTASYANKAYTTSGLERHKSFVYRLSERVGAVPGTLQDWNEHQLIFAAKQADSMAAHDAPRVDTLVMNPCMKPYLDENAVTSNTKYTQIPPGGDPVPEKYGWSTEAWLVDEVFEGGKARIVTDAHCPRCMIIGLAMKDLQIKWTGTPGYFGEKMESLANSASKLVHAQKYGTFLSPVFKNRAAHFIVADAKPHADHVPTWFRNAAGLS